MPNFATPDNPKTAPRQTTWQPLGIICKYLPTHTPMHSIFFNNLPLSTPHAEEVTSEADTNTHGKFTLYSGANVSHVTIPAPGMKIFSTPLLTTNANNQQTKCSHYGMLRIHLPKSNRTLKTHVVANCQVKHNLLSVHDIAQRYGLVSVTSNKGYILDTTRHHPSRIATAPWNGTQYRLRPYLSPNTAFTTRNISLKLRKRKTKQHPLPSYQYHNQTSSIATIQKQSR